MKTKVIMLALALATAIMGYAQNSSVMADSYTGMLSVVKDVPFEDQEVTVSVAKNGNRVSLQLKNLKLRSGRMEDAIGTIIIPDIPLIVAEGSDVAVINQEGMFVIAEGEKASGSDPSAGTGTGGGNTVGGDDQPFADTWIGPTFGTIAYTMAGIADRNGMEIEMQLKVQSAEYNTSLTFRSGDVPTHIASVKCVARENTDGYTITGIPVTSSYRGIVIKRK